MLQTTNQQHTIVIGAGMGGLAAAITLAAAGERVTLLERAAGPGGKMRQVHVGQGADMVGIDAGPTVFTMRHIFDELLTMAETKLEDHLALEPVQCLARHAWPDGSTLDLFADIDHSADAIGDFAGLGAARQYRRFCADARSMYETLYSSFMCKSEPSMKALFAGASVIQLSRTKPFQTLWSALGGYFKDARLQQLYGRYATYVGSSPFSAPATLMLIAHVEQAGVWRIKGGMHELAQTLAKIAKELGVELRYEAEVTVIHKTGRRANSVSLASGERIEGDAVVFNGDSNALSTGLLGNEVRQAATSVPKRNRSLSAMTFAINAPTQGFALDHHNVFFSSNYALEFEELFVQRKLPSEPTVYICAQDRHAGHRLDGPERLLGIVNAPAAAELTDEEIERCELATFNQLKKLGLTIQQQSTSSMIRTGPADFEQLFPASGGALYGQASHGWRASFNRPGQRTAIPCLYLVGGSVHPGAGVPMAALSGLTAARSRIKDRASMSA